MSDEVKRPELPKLASDPDMFSWVKFAMALNMPMEAAANAFLDAFPNYDKENAYTRDELVRKLKGSFNSLKYDNRRPPYSDIKQKKEYLQKFLDCLPVTSPLVRLTDLEVVRQQCLRDLKGKDFVKVGHLLIKAQSATLKEMNILQPPDKKTGFPMPTGPAPWEQKKASEDGESQPQTRKSGDPFGGAIMGISQKEDTEDVDS